MGIAADKSAGAVDESAVVSEAQRGSVEAFSKLVELYKRQAYFAALGLVRNHHDALDLSQEAFARAFRAMGRFDTSRPFYPWLYRILRNLCLNHLKRRARQKEVSIEVIDPRGSESLPDRHADPAEAAARNEMRDRLWRAMEELSPDHREILVLRHFQEMSYAEIAEALECPQGTVMSRLHAARRNLRARIEP